MNNHAYLAVWIYLLTKASIYGNKQFVFNGKQMSLKPGQLITGAYQISKETGVPRGTVERILKTFKSEEQIEIQPTTKYSIITIVKWKKYQGGEEQSEERVRNKRGTSEDNKDSKIDKNSISTSVSKETNDDISSKELTYVSDLEELKETKCPTPKISTQMMAHLKSFNKLSRLDGDYTHDNIFQCKSLVKSIKATLATYNEPLDDKQVLKNFDYMLSKLDDFDKKLAVNIKYLAKNYGRIWNKIESNKRK